MLITNTYIKYVLLFTYIYLSFKLVYKNIHVLLVSPLVLISKLLTLLQHIEKKSLSYINLIYISPCNVTNHYTLLTNVSFSDDVAIPPSKNINDHTAHIFVLVFPYVYPYVFASDLL